MKKAKTLKTYETRYKHKLNMLEPGTIMPLSLSIWMFSFADSTTVNLTWFYADGGFVYNEEFSTLPGDTFARGAE